jgi:ubiquinone biosynthesis protein UbiJ
MTPSDTAADPATRALDALAGLIERALDRLLRLDAGSGELLQQLEGRQLRVALRGAAKGVRLRIAGGRVRPVPDDGSEVDLGIAMEPAALVAWLGRPGAARGLPAGVRIEGDLELARVVERALAGFEPDWELPFVDLFGPTVGPQLARGLGDVLGWGRQQAQALAESAADYGVHEARLVTSRTELEEFNAEVDRLRDDVERLAARLARVAGASGA